MEKFVIKTCDEGLYITYDDYIRENIDRTNDIMHRDLLVFKSIEDAKEFAKYYLNEDETYNIVKLKIDVAEEIVDKVNY